MATSKEFFLNSTLTALNALPGDSAPELYDTSSNLLQSLYKALQTSSQSMLPSYTTSLPKPNTTGTAIALDLGGSTLRVAVIELRPHKRMSGDDVDKLGELRKVLVRNSWSVGDEVKSLRAKEFFDWIAERVRETLYEAGLGEGKGKSLGVTWSFPVT
jgi:hexokinase